MINELLSRIVGQADIYRSPELVRDIQHAIRYGGLKPMQRDYLDAVLIVGHNHLEQLDVLRVLRQYNDWVI